MTEQMTRYPHHMLSREGVERLQAHIGDLGCTQDIYANDLGSLVGGLPEAWLEAALLAGYVPYVWAGPLAIRAYHLWVGEQIREDEKHGRRSVLWGGVTNPYREMISMLEGLVIEIEEWAATRWRDLASADRDRRTMFLREAAEAERRRERAEVRRRSARADHRHAADLWGHEGSGSPP